MRFLQLATASFLAAWVVGICAAACTSSVPTAEDIYSQHMAIAAARGNTWEAIQDATDAYWYGAPGAGCNNPRIGSK